MTDVATEPGSSPPPPSPFAAPRHVDDPTECDFYHTMELPELGLVEGKWDLRGCVDRYLGGESVAGARVLEIGTASGFLCFEMERRGAEVVAFDLSDAHPADIVPRPDLGLSPQRIHALSAPGIRRSNNAFWLAHRLLGSRARVVHGSVYAIPRGIGAIDTVTVGCVLEHLRDPFGALAQAAEIASSRLIVTCVISRRHLPMLLLGALGIAGQGFLPRAAHREAYISWWSLTPRLVREALAVLGFGGGRVTYLRARHRGRSTWLFCVAARRTTGAPRPA